MDPAPVPFEQYSEMFLKARDYEGQFYMIKANVPRDWRSYHSNNGEGVWLVIDEKDNALYWSKAAKKTFYGILCVPCLYHPQLTQRTVDRVNEKITPIEFEWRGKLRPVLANRELEQLIGPDVV
jgi:hypothetical protein